MALTGCPLCANSGHRATNFLTYLNVVSALRNEISFLRECGNDRRPIPERAFLDLPQITYSGAMPY
jgi:hypothetical protein